MKRGTILMAFLLALTLLAGTMPALASAGEPTVLKMYVNNIEKEMSSLETQVGQRILEDLNIEIRYLPYAGDKYERANLMLAGYDWGDTDFVLMPNTAIIADYIASEAVINLDDYRDQLENLYSFEKDLIPYWRISAPDGGLYFWQAGPDMQAINQPPFDILVRTDVLEAMEYPNLQTTDDYVAFLGKALEEFPTAEGGQQSLGMSFGFSAYPAQFATYLVRHSGYQHFYEVTGMIDVENEQIVSLIDSDYGRAAIRFYNTLYREGLMDPEAFTSNWANMLDKMKAGACISAHFMSGYANVASQSLEAEGKDYGYVVMPFRLQEAADDGRARYELYTSLRFDESTGILASSKNIDACLRLINYMATEEMSIACGRGVEGEDYSWEDGKIVMSDTYFEKRSEEGYWTERTFVGGAFFPTRNYGLMENGQPYNVSYDPDVNARLYTPAQRETYDAYGWANNLGGWVDTEEFDYVYTDITPYQSAVALDADSDIGKLYTKLSEYIKAQIVLCMTAQSEEAFETLYDEMLAHAQSLGASSLIAVYNENYEAVVEKLNAYGAMQ